MTASNFPRHQPIVRGIHRSPVNSPHKGQWRGVLMYSFISACMNGSVTNREASDLRRRRTHFDVIVMIVWNDPYRLIFVDIWLNKNKQIRIQTFEENAHIISAVHNKCIHICMLYPVWYCRKLLWSGHFQACTHYR